MTYTKNQNANKIDWLNKLKLNDINKKNKIYFWLKKISSY